LTIGSLIGGDVKKKLKKYDNANTGSCRASGIKEREKMGKAGGGKKKNEKRVGGIQGRLPGKGGRRRRRIERSSIQEKKKKKR